MSTTTQTMTPEAQRIAIAEACGWTKISNDFPDFGAEGVMGLRPNFIHDENREGLPDYPADLNAMHEAEKVLTASQTYDYISCLVDDTRAGWTDAFEEVFIVAHATAAQRAEAFLRTIGKWVE